MLTACPLDWINLFNGLADTLSHNREIDLHSIEMIIVFTNPFIYNGNILMEHPVGIGGTRFISFEGRHWHNNCFVCSSCKASMVGKGFITDAEDIICPECAKKKLMADTVEQ